MESYDKEINEEETEGATPKDEKLLNKKLYIALISFAVSILIYVAARLFPLFAEFWTRYPAQWIRFILAKITGFIPFSLAECIIIALPIVMVAYILGSIISTRKDETNAGINRWTRPMIAVVLALGIVFCLGFGPAFGRKPISENLGLESMPVSAEELYDTAKIISETAYFELDDITFGVDGASVMPYSYKELVKKMNDAFGKYARGVDYISHYDSNPKAIALSEPMTYTHISGVYTFMTGESNVNVNYPDFLLPYTMAHEMAHQRGIAREDEANFVAYLVCIGSDDAYIRYSGYANMLNYLLPALSEADGEKRVELIKNVIPKEIYGEFIAYSQFFDKYRGSTASVVTEKISDVMIKTHGQPAGTKSYGLVVDLAVAYYKSR